MLTTRWFTIIGRTIPPRLEPAVMIPNATARCRRNQVPTAAIAAGKVISHCQKDRPKLNAMTYERRRGMSSLSHCRHFEIEESGSIPWIPMSS
jgi:hypothetical protein